MKTIDLYLKYQLKQIEQLENKYQSDINLITLKVFDQTLNQTLVNRDKLNQIDKNKFEKIFSQYLMTNIPIAYLVGFEYFFGYKIKVNKNVLIPRFETEELVDITIKRIKEKYPKGSTITLADICSGSGVIGIVIALELKDQYTINLIMSDISKQALEVVRENLNYYQLEAIVYQGDMLQPLIKNKHQIDVLVSNPPYIDREDQNIAINVLKYEPHLALFARNSGLSCYERIIDKYQEIVNKQFLLILEIGHLQADSINKIMFLKKSEKFDIIIDINKKDRILIFEG